MWRFYSETLSGTTKAGADTHSFTKTSLAMFFGPKSAAKATTDGNDSLYRNDPLLSLSHSFTLDWQNILCATLRRLTSPVNSLVLLPLDVYWETWNLKAPGRSKYYRTPNRVHPVFKYLAGSLSDSNKASTMAQLAAFKIPAIENEPNVTGAVPFLEVIALISRFPEETLSSRVERTGGP